MCTVTFIPGVHGYRLAMNRDERRTRVKGRFTGPRLLDGLSVLGPSEPAGGMWACANAATGAFALVNWYSKPAPRIENPISRGTLVKALAGSRQSGEVEARLFKQPLERVRPFRLIVLFGTDQSLREWRWDAAEVTCVDHAWSSRQWASSGYDEPAARQSRQKVFEAALARKGAGELEWLRALHGSHEPEKGAVSICMHREEAATVSYTEIELNAKRIRISYCDGAPCESDRWQEREISLEATA